ncbi:hypothetical protein EJ08DRAFT_647313 [Tothia fuscella]|uniref:Uncharacterized protein n=1 Tax=Tothia fuscella TaxID=1048955 RepID=A0A9P4NXT7_9PEZI|nr:hypothetical protein EJ08DRAFT_647313 [Tothia fuscella]
MSLRVPPGPVDSTFQGAYLRPILIAFACIVILWDEYRLEVNGLLFAIPAIILSGTANACRPSNQFAFEQEAVTTHHTQFQFFGLSCGFFISLTWCWAKGEYVPALETLHLGLLPILVLNVATSATAYVTGASLILSASRSQYNYSYRSLSVFCSMDQAKILGSRATFVALSSLLLLRRVSFTTLVQLLAFIFALVVIDGRCFPNSKADYSVDVEQSIYDTLLDTPVRKEIDPEVIFESNSTKSTSFISTNILTTAGLFSLLLFAVLNFESKGIKNGQLTLDVDYHPATEMEIVISMYKEPLDSVNTIISRMKNIPQIPDDVRIHIYSKDADSDVRYIKTMTGAHNVTKLPNVGREGATYLHHITHNWDTLAKHTLFVQADIHNPREFFPRLEGYFDPQHTGMLSLGFSGQVCDGQSCGDRWGWKDTSGAIPEIYHQVYNQTASDVLLSYKGQFIASARRIRGIKKAIYERLLDELDDPQSWAHGEEYLQGREDSLDKPVFGYTLERLWNTLLQCSDMEVAWKCPTLLSGTRRGGWVGDCQCFDVGNEN